MSWVGVLISLLLVPGELAAQPVDITSPQARRAAASPAFAEHLQDYRRCGIKHFENLGKTSTVPFDKVETTVRAACGHHIERGRAVLTAFGMKGRAEQNRLIASSYDSVVSEFFKAYNRQGQVTQYLGRERQLNEEWRECAVKFATGVALSNLELADTIARSALAICLKEENALYAFHKELGIDFAQRMNVAMRKVLHDQLTAVVMATRAGAVRERAAEPAKPSGQGI